MKKLTINGIELAYERMGAGQPLLLLHGYPLDHHLWDSLTPLLLDSFDLLLPDLRGFGASSSGEAVPGMGTFASDLAGLLDHLGISTAYVVGHSMGGYVALTFARQYPQRISGLGLVGSQVLADPPDRKEGRYKTAAEALEKGIQGVVDGMAPKFTPKQELLGTIRQMMQRQAPLAYVGALKAMAERQDSTELVTRFTFPVVLVHGEADELIPVARAREVKAAVPHAVLAELPGVGHLPMLEAPGETAEAIRCLI